MKTLEKRPYQQDCLKALGAARKKGSKTALVHMATGLGKTYLSVQDVKKVSQGKPLKVLFTSHMTDILREAKDEFQRQLPELNPQFITLQGLFQNLDTYASDAFDYIIYDEAHHVQAKTFKTVVKHFDPKFALGLTATPARADGRKIADLFGDAVYEMSLPHALSDGHLARLDYQIVFDQKIKEAIEKGFTVSSILELRELLKIKVRNEQIVASIRGEKKRMKLDHVQTIVFCQSIEHCKQMAELLGGSAYHSGLNNSEKDRIFSSFQSGELEVICTRDMFNEGVNIPDARLIVFLRSTASRTVFLQQLGRGLRKTKTKRQVSVLDFVGNVERLEHVQDLIHDIGKYESKENEMANDTEHVFSFAGGSFQFTHQAIDILKKLDEMYDDIPKGFIYLADLDKKYGYFKRGISEILERAYVPVVRLRRGICFRKAVSAKDWNDFLAKNPNKIIPVLDRSQDLFTVDEICEKHLLVKYTFVKRLERLGYIFEKRRLPSGAIVRVMSSFEVRELKKSYPNLFYRRIEEKDVSIKSIVSDLNCSYPIIERLIKKHGFCYEQVASLSDEDMQKVVSEATAKKIKEIYLENKKPRVLPENVYLTPGKKYKVRVFANKKSWQVGVFDTIEEAVSARNTALAESKGEKVGS